MNKIMIFITLLAISGCKHTPINSTSYQAFRSNVQEVPNLLEPKDYLDNFNDTLVSIAIQNARSRKQELEFDGVVKGGGYLFYVFRLRYAEDVLIIYTTKDNRTFTDYFSYSGELPPRL